ncbi:hypothetical protein COU37_04400 [Candidatus Micrarchaeota archaeon CG10_big_fil_rev_8_21_14_0_10_45_29]|nr:MAG: hypothetical protein COU37_04400 [Candidatus Micrarchaeota archaeon CG10_big_fil_rev_8_21_14_0_10_45_29]
MESSRQKALGITKYFVSLPSARFLLGACIFFSILFGAIMGALDERTLGLWALIGGAAAALIAVAAPSILSGAILSFFRHRVTLGRAMAISLLSSLIYLLFFLGAAALGSNPAKESVVFVGFGLAFLLWLFSLKFAFGLERSCWIFAFLQMALHALFLVAGTSLYDGSIRFLLLKVILTSLVFVGALYAVLFLASRPLKKNLGLSSNDVLSMFSSQWLFQEKDLEDAFDELGEEALTWIGACTFSTRNGKMQWIVPYFHFGPFGNLGGSQFSSLISKKLSSADTCAFVFHGSATHDLDPVSSSSINYVIRKCNEALSSIKLQNAHYSIRQGKGGDSHCACLEINDDMLSFFSRAPYSTEDINLSVGWALMERMRRESRESLLIDCHNCETGEVDYIESGSPASFEMADALENALAKKKFSGPLKAGWAFSFPTHISGVASAGIKVACLEGEAHKAMFFVLLDSNGIINSAREHIENSIRKKFPRTSLVQILTTDTHELNSVKGVFNPAGVENIDLLEAQILTLCESSHKLLSPCKFGMSKVRIRLKVLGASQSAEIVSTLNAVFSLLKFAVPAGLIAAIGAAIWLLGKV